MKQKILSILLLTLAPAFAHAGLMDDLNKSGGDLGTQVAEKAKAKSASEGNKKIAAQLNKKLLAEGRKNQCSFKSDSDELEPGCGTKAQKLARPS